MTTNIHGTMARNCRAGQPEDNVPPMCFQGFLETVSFRTRQQSHRQHHCAPTHRGRKKCMISNFSNGCILEAIRYGNVLFYDTGKIRVVRRPAWPQIRVYKKRKKVVKKLQKLNFFKYFSRKKTRIYTHQKNTKLYSPAGHGWRCGSGHGIP